MVHVRPSPRTRMRGWCAALVALLLVASGAGIAAQANAALGGISGTVTVPAGADVSQVVAEARTPQPDGWAKFVKSAQVAADGTYVIDGLPAGVYVVVFRDASGTVQDRWNGGAVRFSEANQFAVEAGRIAPHIDVSLPATAQIKGRVVGPEGESYEGHRVNVLWTEDDGASWSEGGRGAVVAADGTFHLAGLKSFPTKIYVSGHDRLHTLHSGGAASYEEATALDLVPGQVLEDVLITGPRRGSARFLVGGPVGADLSRLDVHFERWNTVAKEWDPYYESATYGGLEWEKVGDRVQVTRGSLAPGRYRVGISDRRGLLADAWLGGSEATREVTVAPGEQADAGAVTLRDKGSIEVSVTLPTGLGRVGGVDPTIMLWSDLDQRWAPVYRPKIRRVNAVDQNSAMFSFVGLEDGRYRIGFDDYNARVMDRWVGGATLDTAADVVIEDGARVTGLSVTMLLPGQSEPTPEPTPTPTPKPVAPTPKPNPPVKPPVAKVLSFAKAPKVTGKARVGKTLKASRIQVRSSVKAKVRITYRWETKKGKKFVVVKGATKSKLKLTKKLRGKQVRLRVTVTAPGHKTLVRATKWSKKVA